MLTQVLLQTVHIESMIFAGHVTDGRSLELDSVGMYSVQNHECMCIYLPTLYAELSLLFASYTHAMMRTPSALAMSVRMTITHVE